MFKKYYLYKKQYSDDNGAHWYDVSPEEVTISGDPIGEYETLEECEQATPATEGYLAIIPRGNGNIQLSGASDTFQYSFNSGVTWNNATSATSITMNEGVSLLFKGTLVPNIGKFESTCEFEAAGNPMSLLYGDDFNNRTSVPRHAFRYLFDNCINLVSIDNLKLPATELEDSCYDNMFYNCRSLTSIPSGLLPATTMKYGCYKEMFNRCYNLVNVPSDLLPATTLAGNCYLQMFFGCENLTVAPTLPAKTLVSGCYDSMFKACGSLNNITCLATDVSATNCTEQWVDGVAANGTFTKAQGFLGWSQGVDGIPNGWTVQEA